MDTVSGALTTVGYEHHENHEGNAYLGIHSLLRDDTEFIEVRIQTPNTTKWGHMVVIMKAALAATVELWEDTTKTDIPGQRFGMNKNRNSPNGTGLLICHTPGGTEVTPPDIQEYIGAATTGGRSDTGGSSGGRGEFILKQNSAYLLKMTSRVNSNALSIVLDWYEHQSRA